VLFNVLNVRVDADSGTALLRTNLPYVFPNWYSSPLQFARPGLNVGISSIHPIVEFFIVQLSNLHLSNTFLNWFYKYIYINNLYIMTPLINEAFRSLSPHIICDGSVDDSSSR